MNRPATGIFAIVAVLAVLMWAAAGMAYDTYSGTQCSVCHSGFQGKGPLHDLHLTFISNNCGMCHPSSPGSTPVSTSEANDATSLSCLGCHGRDYGAFGYQAAGLRAHHAAHGVTVCNDCHRFDPQPLPENVLPPHFGRSDVSLTSSCSDNLDNDGDDLYDDLDTDCALPVEETTWGRIKAFYQ